MFRFPILFQFRLRQISWKAGCRLRLEEIISEDTLPSNGYCLLFQKLPTKILCKNCPRHFSIFWGWAIFAVFYPISIALASIFQAEKWRKKCHLANCLCEKIAKLVCVRKLPHPFFHFFGPGNFQKKRQYVLVRYAMADYVLAILVVPVSIQFSSQFVSSFSPVFLTVVIIVVIIFWVFCCFTPSFSQVFLAVVIVVVIRSSP